MKIRDLLERVKDLPPDTPLCVAEVDEAFGVNIVGIEIVENAVAQDEQASGREAIELGNGQDKVVVIRW